MINESYCNRETCKKIQDHIGGLRIQNDGYHDSHGVIYDWETEKKFINERIPVYTQSVALRWITDIYKRNIELTAYPHEDGCFYWAYDIFYMNEKDLKYSKEYSRAGFDSKEDAAEDAINYFIDYIIDD